MTAKKTYASNVPPNGQVFHWWVFQLGFEIFGIKFKEAWNFAEYVEDKSWDNPTAFLACMLYGEKKNYNS